VGHRIPPRHGRGSPQAWARLIHGRLTTLLLAALLAACSGGDGPAEPTPEPQTPPPGSAGDDDDATGPATGHVPVIHYTPKGLSALYARFFGDEEALDRLAVDLGRELSADSVALEVVWNDVDKAGGIILYVPETDRRGEPLADAVQSGAPLDMTELSRLMGAVGRYREYLGGRYDLRILSFEMRLSFWDARLGSNCWIGGAIGDPEGTQVGPCFVCMDHRAEGGHVRACRDGDAWPAPLEGEDRALRRVRSALRSNPP